MIYWMLGVFGYLVIAMIVAAAAYEDSYPRGAVGSVIAGLMWPFTFPIFIACSVIVFPFQLLFEKPKEPEPPPKEADEA